jgi:hydrogenase maturation protease
MTNTATRMNILIAGIGNIFHGDDAFGSEVARRLLPMSWPHGVKVVDFGIRGIDLTYALLDEPDVAILIDATPQNAQPGALCVIEPDLSETGQNDAGPTLLDAHSLNPMNVLRQVKALGGRLPRILLIGCEPAELGGDDGYVGLSEPVQAAVAEAIVLSQQLVSELLEERCQRETSND